MTEQQKAEAYVYSQIPKLNDLQLQHWLRVLEQASQISLEFNHYKGTVLYVREEYSEKPFIGFDLTTGQPATEADYKAFNDIVGI